MTLDFLTYYKSIKNHLNCNVPVLNEDWDIVDNLCLKDTAEENEIDKVRLILGCVLRHFKTEKKINNLANEFILDMVNNEHLDSSFLIELSRMAKVSNVIEEANKYFSHYILPNIDNFAEVECEIKKLIQATDEKEFINSSVNLKSHLLYLTEGEKIKSLADFLSGAFLESIHISALHCTLRGNDLYKLNFDPYEKYNTFSKSSAMKIIIKTQDDLFLKTLHHFNHFEDFICEERYYTNFFAEKIPYYYLILSAKRDYHNPGKVYVYVQKTPYILRCLEGEDDFEKARNFIQRHLKEFKTKTIWRNRNLADMAYAGYKSLIWIAYAYFNENNDIISLVDYKIRSDTDVEIGIILTDGNYRRKSLANSIVLFLRMMHVMRRFYVGTYEENTPMRNLFEKNGFITDGKLVRDRGAYEDRNNPSRLGCSLYYYANPLIDKP